ncbi:MAG: hypothetical protein H6562_10985 [Lewinellaceae bacterium]|nr:hypothetical protein [Lewinellaceae bacterium]
MLNKANNLPIRFFGMTLVCLLCNAFSAHSIDGGSNTLQYVYEIKLSADQNLGANAQVNIILKGHLGSSQQVSLQSLSQPGSWPLATGKTSRFTLSLAEPLGELISLTTQSSPGSSARLTNITLTGEKGESYATTGNISLQAPKTTYFFFDHSKLKEISARTKPAIPDINQYINAHPKIAAALQWQPPTGNTPIAYPDWPASMKVELARYYNWLKNGRNFGFLDPPRLVNVSDASGITVISERDARQFYLGNVARSIFSETQLPWSLDDLSEESLSVLFGVNSSYAPHYRFPAGQYAAMQEHDDATEQMATVPGDASLNYHHLEELGMIGSTRLETIANLCKWINENCTHIAGTVTLNGLGFFNQYSYPSAPTAHQILKGYDRPGVDYKMAGCGGTARFVQQLLRTVNIPVEVDYSSIHAQLRFTSEQLAMSHGDDLYGNTIKYQDFPVEDLLIPEQLFLDYFHLFDQVGKQSEIVKGKLDDMNWPSRTKLPVMASSDPDVIAYYKFKTDGKELMNRSSEIHGEFDDGFLVQRWSSGIKGLSDDFRTEDFCIRFFFMRNYNTDVLLKAASGAMSISVDHRGLVLNINDGQSNKDYVHYLSAQIPNEDTWHDIMISGGNESGIIRVLLDGHIINELKLENGLRLNPDPDAFRNWDFGSGNQGLKMASLYFIKRSLSADEMFRFTKRTKDGGVGTPKLISGFKPGRPQREDRYWALRGMMPIQAPAGLADVVWALPQRNPIKTKLLRLDIVPKLELPDSSDTWIMAEYVGVVVDEKRHLTAPLQELPQSTQDYVLTTLGITEPPEPPAPPLKARDKYAYLLPGLPIQAPADEKKRTWSIVESGIVRKMDGVFEKLDKSSKYQEVAPDQPYMWVELVSVYFEEGVNVPLQILSQKDQEYILNKIK